MSSYNLKLNPKAKGFYASLTKAILGVGLDKEIEEFEKAGIVLKTVRLKENELPKEDISFPAFHYEELIHESWDDSGFKDILESKFFFVFYQFEGTELKLRKVKFWNMPSSDIEKAKLVWEKTISLIKEGDIVKEIDERGRRTTNFPNKAFNEVSHVRPHARDAKDTYPLPRIDQVSGLKQYTKHSFWLNGSYIKSNIYLNNPIGTTL